MISDRRVIAVIPARGGSKGLPGKNIRPLLGKPMIAWSIEQALNTPEIDTVVVTTDSEEIASVARDYGAEVPFLRPHELSTDEAMSIDVVMHCLEFYRTQRNQEFDYVLLLEPTSPLRECDDLSKIISLLRSREMEANAVISVGEVQEHPMSQFIMEEKKYLQELIIDCKTETRRQDKPVFYISYGGVYLVKNDVLLSEKSFYPHRSLGFPLKRYQNYDVDDLYDFIALEAVMKFEWGL